MTREDIGSVLGSCPNLTKVSLLHPDGIQWVDLPVPSTLRKVQCDGATLKHPSLELFLNYPGDYGITLRPTET